MANIPIFSALANDSQPPSALDSDSPGLSPSCHTWMAQASLSADLFFCHRAMSPHGAVYSAVSVDPTHPLIQPHTDHRRTTRSKPPFFVPVTASSDARGRPFRTGSNTPCHTSGTRHSCRTASDLSCPYSPKATILMVIR